MAAPWTSAPPIAAAACPLIESGALARSVRAFRQAAREGCLQPLLKGRKLGVLCDEPARAEVQLVHRAALELGAHVSLVHPGFDEASDSAALVVTARTLGRLYDVVACPALSPRLVRQLRAAAGIPVIDDECIAAAGPAALGPGESAASDDDRRFLWQAVLAASLA